MVKLVNSPDAISAVKRMIFPYECVFVCVCVYFEASLPSLFGTGAAFCLQSVL